MLKNIILRNHMIKSSFHKSNVIHFPCQDTHFPHLTMASKYIQKELLELNDIVKEIKKANSSNNDVKDITRFLSDLYETNCTGIYDNKSAEKYLCKARSHIAKFLSNDNVKFSSILRNLCENQIYNKHYEHRLEDIQYDVEVFIPRKINENRIELENIKDRNKELKNQIKKIKIEIKENEKILQKNRNIIPKQREKLTEYEDILKSYLSKDSSSIDLNDRIFWDEGEWKDMMNEDLSINN